MTTLIRPTKVTAISDDYQEHIARRSVNPGTDYMTPKGTPAVAAHSGRVTLAHKAFAGSGGRMVFVVGEGFETQYLHLSRIDVTVGQVVRQGQQLGLTGGSAMGSETGVGNHLHLSIRVGGALHDFEALLAQQAAGVAGSAGGSQPVRDGQNLLNRFGYRLVVDGINGNATKAAVRDYQSKHGLVVDGVIGSATAADLRANIAALDAGGSGPVRDGQNLLNRFGYRLVVDGINGNATKAAVRDYQSRHGLTVDGIIGPRTAADMRANLAGR
jgi:hypothetical protein